MTVIHDISSHGAVFPSTHLLRIVYDAFVEQFPLLLRLQIEALYAPICKRFIQGTPALQEIL
jgi:hypothetical protein